LELIKPFWYKARKIIVVTVGLFSVMLTIYVAYAYNFNYKYIRGTIIGRCDIGTRIGVEVKYSIKNKVYKKCSKMHKDKSFKKGDVVYLRVLNMNYSFAWIDYKKTVIEKNN
jgi:hypothetical protein